MRAVVVVALSTLGCGGPAGPPDDSCPTCTALTADQVFDGTQGGPGTVIFDQGRVTKLVRGAPNLLSGTQETLTGMAIVPGLIDLHVHALRGATPYNYGGPPDASDDRWKAFLRAGVTTVLDLGSSQHVIFAWRDRLRSGAMLGPNLFAAGPMLTPTGGHPCYKGEPPGDLCRPVDLPADAQAALSLVLPDRPDAVKIILESGGMFYTAPRMTDPSIAAAASAAQSANLPLIAHVGEAKDVDDALAAGVRRFAHLPFEDKLTAAECQAIAAADGTVIPTLAFSDSESAVSLGTLPLGDPALADDVSADVIASLGDKTWVGAMQTATYKDYAHTLQVDSLANFKTCLAAGVRFAAGTDAGNPGDFHGLSLHRELALYVQNGMTPEQALVSATSAAADFLGAADLGRIAPGAVADLVVVPADPLADLSKLDQIQRVYRAGVKIDRDALALPRATSIVQTPVTGLKDGATCLEDGECGAEVCSSFESICRASCNPGDDGPCIAKSSCLALTGPGQSGGACYPSDGCDPLAQDCANAAACVFLSNGATECDYAGSGTAGMSCKYGCAPGTQCLSNICLALCLPGGPNNGGCPNGRTCVDHSAEAGLSIGACL